jgi:hypothetical protein
MKKAIILILIGIFAMNVFAVLHKPKHSHRPPPAPPRHHVPHHPPKHHAPKHHDHHHHKSGGAAVAAGIIGGAIVGAAIAESLKPDPVVVTPAPVVVQQPVVVAQPVTQVQNVWVEGRYVHRRDAHGRMVRVWEPGHYEQRTVTISP